MTEAGSLFQYFTTLTENADPLLQRRLATWMTLNGCPLRPRRAGGRKNKFGLGYYLQYFFRHILIILSWSRQTIILHERFKDQCIIILI